MGSVVGNADEALGHLERQPEARLRPRILDLFEAARKDGRPLHVSAPMVRYSKLAFRLLVRDYGVDVAYTPMMLAHEFIRSPAARDSDFTTAARERQPTAADGRPHALVAQFASRDPDEFARAADLIAPWVDGVDLNCGCPQSWAVKDGIGCALMEDPDRVARMVRAAKARLPATTSVSAKIRIHHDLAQTVAFAQTVQRAGLDFITVHGRRRTQRSSTPPDYAAVRHLRAHLDMPVIANGDAHTLAGVRHIAHETGADGIMAARGILENPALFTGCDTTPAACVRAFVAYAVRSPMPFALVLHHVSEMSRRTEGMASKEERRRLMACRDFIDLIDFVEGKFGGPGGGEEDEWR